MGKPEKCCTRAEAITDIISSIAMEQYALADILKAESEKLTNIMESTQNPKILLQTNESIRETIKSITKLEKVLQSKLTAFGHRLYDNCKEVCEK